MRSMAILNVFISEKNGIKKKYLTNEQKNVKRNLHILWLDKLTMAVLFYSKHKQKEKL